MCGACECLFVFVGWFSNSTYTIAQLTFTLQIILQQANLVLPGGKEDSNLCLWWHSKYAKTIFALHSYVCACVCCVCVSESVVCASLV